MPQYCIKDCKHHGQQRHVIVADGHKRCTKCRSEAVARRRRVVKEKLVAHFGGKCQRCGYNKSVCALEFHHKDPKDKRFGLAFGGWTRAYSEALKEAEKCILICANCHREEHEK